MSLYTRPTIAGCYKRCAITVLSVFKTRRIAYCSIVANLPRFNFLLSPVITMFARWRFVGRVIIVIVASVHAISQQGQQLALTVVKFALLSQTGSQYYVTAHRPVCTEQQTSYQFNLIHRTEIVLKRNQNQRKKERLLVLDIGLKN